MTVRHKFVAFVTGVILAWLAICPSPALAVTTSPIPSGTVVGLIVHYRVGTEVRLADGTAEVSKYSPTVLQEVRALGSGLHEVSFSRPTSIVFAKQVADQIAALDPNVISTGLNLNLGSSSAASRAVVTEPKTLTSSKIRPSAVRQLHTHDLWSGDSPRQSSVKISWLKPWRLSGGRLASYNISVAIGADSKFISFKNTRQRSVSIRNLTPGEKYVFKVTTVVKKGSSYFRGKERLVSFLATAAPRPPVLNTPQVIFGLSNVSWQVQSKQQTGGLKTTYTVKASSGSEAVGCQTSGNSCILQLDTSLGTYRVSVSASNAKGSSVNLVSPTISDPLFNRQWYLNGENGINAENAWASTLGSQSITVAVIDTGVVNHKDFSDSLMLDSNNRPYGFDFVSNSASSGDGDGWDFDPTDPGDYSSSTYSSWHGTEVTGLISATHNSIGIAGLASDTQIVSVRALGKDGGTLSDFLAAINWSAGIHVPGVEDNSHPAQIINLSLAGDSNMSCDTNAQSVLNRVESAGAIVVTAAGNGSTDLANSFPSNCAGVISVASSDRYGDLESYSNFGAQLSIAAPGGDLIYGLLTTSNSGKTIAESDTYSRDFGTSFSAPLVTGTIALMLSVNPRLSKAQVIEILERSANKFKDGTRCSETDICGPGILNAAAAVELADLLNY